MSELSLTMDDPQEISREERFLDNLEIYRDPVKAALAAGYSKSYAELIKYQKLTSKHFRAKLLERFKGSAILELLNIGFAEHKAFEDLADEINADRRVHKLSKLAPIIKQKKQEAGILAQDTPSQPTININELKVLITNGIPDEDPILTNKVRR
jgi:hypothetical protein